MTRYWLGKKLSEEHKLKISLGGKGKKRIFTPEWRRNLSLALKGKKTNHPPWNKGKKTSTETIEKIRKTCVSKGVGKWNKGRKTWTDITKHPWWIDGRSKNSSMKYSSSEYTTWRTQVFRRDKFTCVFCGARNGNGKSVILNADHIKPVAEYPNLIYEVENGRTLCHECHKKTPTYGWKYSWIIRKKHVEPISNK
jgi:hypothetical protein